ncbi:1-acyl-sn-glycerol-3-phosphate acyltransferase [bacterium]|nr:MAG: 1-acyl-sn-glycerol-3-phosphate acyltransferase [bacterium]
MFTVAALATLALLLVLPSLPARRRLAHGGARIALALMGMRLKLIHPERLPAGPCVVVANHASYLDGVVLKAALPPRFGFVIKREMNRVPLANLLLRRIGSEFVERARTGRGARDARRLLKQARSDVSLAFFPEGTFGDEPGLLRFQPGAFVFAARAGVPLVPVALRGTRRALPPRVLWPWPMRIEIEVLEPLDPRGGDGAAGAGLSDLRAAARAAILSRIDEPDLAEG